MMGTGDLTEKCRIGGGSEPACGRTWTARYLRVLLAVTDTSDLGAGCTGCEVTSFAFRGDPVVPSVFLGKCNKFLPVTGVN